MKLKGEIDQRHGTRDVRMEEWDGGIVEMTGKGRRGDERCGSSILRVSAACGGAAAACR